MSLKWFSIGLGVGTGIAILSTPKMRAATRSTLKAISGRARRYAAGRIEEEYYTITDVINEINQSEKAVTDNGAADGAADKLREAS